MRRPGHHAIPSAPACPSNAAALPGAPGAGQPGLGESQKPEVDRKKAPKAPSLQRKFAGKVSTLSSKITELKCMQTQLSASDLSRVYLGRTTGQVLTSI